MPGHDRTAEIQSSKSSPSRSARRALVLGGGGLTGIAWQLGVLCGLSRVGVDVGDVDLIIGTSGGATVGAQLATGQLGAAIEMQLSPETAEVHADFDVQGFYVKVKHQIAGTASAKAARARIGKMALAAHTIDESRRRAIVAARLPDTRWPEAVSLQITAVDAETGEMTVFDQDSRIDLVTAVAASSAVPGIWPPVTIKGNRYIDGGVRSLTNADLGKGCHRALILMPTEAHNPRRVFSECETAGFDKFVVIEPDRDAASVVRREILNPTQRAPALNAGIAQGIAAHLRVEELFAEEGFCEARPAPALDADASAPGG
jgi:NTE family protein